MAELARQIDEARADLAKRFGVSQQHISKIKRGHRWPGGAA